MHPCYLSLSDEELSGKADSLWRILKSCTICPRDCKVNRLKGEKGFCRTGALPYISSVQPHFGEEGPISGSRGSGTIFFAGCNLACVFCQNYEISQLDAGYEVSYEELARLMLSLQNKGCHNINLVSPTHQVPAIVKALDIAREKGLNIPLVYNSGGYDSVETLRLLDGIIDIYMPDMKYGDEKMAEKYSMAPDYYRKAMEALKEMHRQVGDLVVDETGVAVRGLLVRHLVLPKNISGSMKVFGFLAREVSQNTAVNVMDQYHPCHKAGEYPELMRRITKEEYREALDSAENAGLRII